MSDRYDDVNITNVDFILYHTDIQLKVFGKFYVFLFVNVFNLISETFYIHFISSYFYTFWTRIPHLYIEKWQ